MKSLVRPELPTAASRSSQATHAAVDNSAPFATHPESTYKSGKVVQTTGATSIGHEIRSPLQALQSLHPLGDRSRRYIDRISGAVTQLFGGAGPEASFNARSIVLESVDLRLYLAEIAENAPLADIPNVVYTGPPDRVMCMIDRTVLEDAITNILTNGHRYRPTKSPIRIDLKVLEDKAVIDISNDGPPIGEEDLEQIFDLYFSSEQIKDGHKRGIGLFAARNYVSRMSGTISAHNDLSGVTFRIRLPIISESTD